ncbi:MAG: type II secretion system GspH family protein [Clostridiales bacterium]|jgi:type II secretory pathway pseudopilin PulG|nr:type II secretion system GspH family protein [Clostridiales bacterium]
MRNDKGFSAAGLVVALAVILIMAAAAAPLVRSVDKFYLRREAAVLKNNLRRAQRLAVAEGRERVIVFDEYNECYTIRARDTAGVLRTESKTYFQNGVVLKFVRTRGTDKIVRYDPRGMTNDPCTIMLAKGGLEIKLTVNLGAGRVYECCINSKCANYKSADKCGCTDSCCDFSRTPGA